MIKAILFDLDGLLVDSETLGIETATAICKEINLNLSNSEKKSFIGVTDKKFYKDLFKKNKISKNIDEILKKHFTIYEKSLRTKLKPFPGATSLPKRLKDEGLRLALVSGSTKKQINIILKKLGLNEIFEVIISCEDITHSKPNSEGYLLASKKLCIKPSECLVLEDATTGIIAGRTARMKVIGVKNNGEQDLSEADVIIPDLEHFFEKKLLDIQEESCYHGGSSFNAIGTDFSDLENKEKVIRADVTDAWYNPTPKIGKALSNDLNWYLRNSPPTHCEGLIKTISSIRHIPEENILVGGGSSDLMYVSFLQLLKKNEEVIIIDPMYGEYEHIFKNVVGARIKRVLQDKKEDFKIDSKRIISKINSKTRLVVLVNPNNPTGQYLTKKEMTGLINKIPKDIILFIDETYIDYIGQNESMETMVSNYPNLIVLKSMSKIYALSGARVAYLTANKDLINKLIIFNPPWAVGLIGQITGVLALKDKKYYLQKINDTKKMNQELRSIISKIPGLRPINSVGNFILIELIEQKLSAQKIVDDLEKKNIYIRNPDSQSTQLNDRFIRIGIKQPKDNKKLIKELQKTITKLLS